jgi:hypothetical protein
VNAHVEYAIAMQGDHMQWVEGRLAALRGVAGYLATYPPNYVGRQISWLAQALGFERMTVTRELADAFSRLPVHAAEAASLPTELRGGFLNL